MDNILGRKYKLKNSDNFEEYMAFVDIGLLYRKTAVAVSPTACLTREDDGTYSLTLSATLRTTRMTFKLGEEFIEERADGVKVKSTVVAEGEDLIQTQIEDNGRKSVHIRKFTPETLTVITTADGWDGKCIRVYELVQ